MNTRARKLHEQYEKFKELNLHKNYAITKAMKKFHSIPLEPEDLEYIAWEAFIETENKWDPGNHKKTYTNFYRDCLYWRAKDYCIKYSGLKHKACNLADSYQWEIDHKDHESENQEMKLISKLTLDSYIIENSNTEKGHVLRMFIEDLPLGKVCKEAAMSKSKLYRVIEEIKVDLAHMIN